MLRFLRALDRHRLLGFSIWEFSFRSLSRLYGRIFVRDIILRHPLRTLASMLAYHRFSHQFHPALSSLSTETEVAITLLRTDTDADLQREIIQAEADTERGLLVALGFCQKPVGAPGDGCPAGRFNHECLVLARTDLLKIGTGIESPIGPLPPPCQGCDVRVIGTAALQAGAAVYIMTSAVDIARHLFIPTLENPRLRYGIFLQCSYSIPAIVLPLLICRIQSLLVGYNKGGCSDYPQFLLADEGTKDERTCLNSAAHGYVLDLLHDIAEARQSAGQRYQHFRQDGPVFVPAINT